MKVKVGDFVRVGNRISYMTAKNINKYWNDEIDKIANTPQELVQVGDLVELENDALTIKIEVINMRLKHLQSCHLEYNLDMFTITKIYIPNEDKSVYTLQWEAK